MSEIKTIEQLFVDELLDLREENEKLRGVLETQVRLNKVMARRIKELESRLYTEEDWEDRRFQDADWE